MSQHNPSNYMDRVPVKISEKYKPPPKISIPQAIVHRLRITSEAAKENNKNEDDECSTENNNDNILKEFLGGSHSLDYDFNLERNVLLKIGQWKEVRETKKENRRERLRKYALECARSIEEKQKQLLTAVSYPNAEDLLSDDDENSTICKSNNNNKNNSNNNNSIISNNNEYSANDPVEDQTIKNAHENKSHFRIPASGAISTANSASISLAASVNVPNSSSPVQNFDTILMPTVVPDSLRYKQVNLHSVKQNFNNINYSDFENDTSSPFDNIELKTINDLDILAQVLNKTQMHSNNTSLESAHSQMIDSRKENVPNENNTMFNVNIWNIENKYDTNEENSLNSGSAYCSGTLTNVEPTFHFNETATSKVLTSIGKHSSVYSFPLSTENKDSYYSNYEQIQHNLSSQNSLYMNGYAKSNFYYSSNLQGNQSYNVLHDSNHYVQRNVDQQINAEQYQRQHMFNSLQLPPVNQLTFDPNCIRNSVITVDGNASHITTEPARTEVLLPTAKSKSKSVPDILKELNDEIRSSEMRRTRNNCQTPPVPEKKKAVAVRQINQNIPESFLRLSPSTQLLVKNISLMGFPLERVSKIAEKLGSDDKKIVEHLIPLSELMDLGFNETEVSEALLKFNNNKEKALDSLIS